MVKVNEGPYFIVHDRVSTRSEKTYIVRKMISSTAFSVVAIVANPTQAQVLVDAMNGTCHASRGTGS